MNLTAGDIEIFTPHPDGELSSWVIQVAAVHPGWSDEAAMVEWVAYRVVAVDDDGLCLDFDNKLPVVPLGAMSLPPLPLDHADIRFSRKWDGCMNVLIDQGDWAHFCEPKDIQGLAAVLLHLEDISSGVVTG